MSSLVSLSNSEDRTQWARCAGIEFPEEFVPFPVEIQPQINGRPVEWISDIREAPGGSNFEYSINKIIGSELLINVIAVATDQFTLYLEKGSLEGGIHPILLAGIHLEASGRKEGEEPSWHKLKFQIPFGKDVYFKCKVLLPVNACPLLAQPPRTFPITLQQVEKLQRGEDHDLLFHRGVYMNGRIRMTIGHHFPVIGFRFEYEAVAMLTSSGTILNAELYAIKDHENRGCACSRMEMIQSVVEFALYKLGQGKLDGILIAGLECAESFASAAQILIE